MTPPDTPAAEVDAELYARMVAYFREATSSLPTDESAIVAALRRQTEARAIAALLPKPLDPDLIEAREIAAQQADERYAFFTFHAGSNTPQNFREGLHDGDRFILSLVAAIKRGRELAELERAK